MLYAGSIRALVQGIAQPGPSFDAPDWITRWFVIAGVIGFPFWLAFAWFHEFTPGGLKRESAIDPGDSIAHSTSRKLDFWTKGILAAAIVLLTSQLVRRRPCLSRAIGGMRIEQHRNSSNDHRKAAVNHLQRSPGVHCAFGARLPR